MQAIKDWMAANKVSVTFMGGVIVISTLYGTCSYDPTSSTPEPQEEQGEELP
tara:strand:+ start:370 stop:525 length:156 start_codon:yes stop_codon:yes gene_type:complete